MLVWKVCNIKAKYFAFCCCSDADLPSSINFDLFLFHLRDADCDLRVQLPGVALEHAKISRSENREVSLYPGCFKWFKILCFCICCFVECSIATTSFRKAFNLF